MGSGWIKVHRKLLDHPLWQERPFSKGQAWVDLLLLTNHAGDSVLLGNEIRRLKRGQYHTSELKLAERWGWSRKKVRGFLRLLENQKMAAAEGTSRGTTITIENYGIYQGPGPARGNGAGPGAEQPGNRPGYRNKNVKKAEKEKREGERYICEEDESL